LFFKRDWLCFYWKHIGFLLQRHHGLTNKQQDKGGSSSYPIASQKPERPARRSNLSHSSDLTKRNIWCMRSFFHQGAEPGFHYPDNEITVWQNRINDHPPHKSPKHNPPPPLPLSDAWCVVTYDFLNISLSKDLNEKRHHMTTQTDRKWEVPEGLSN
jgi:hypothetical protein